MPTPTPTHTPRCRAYAIGCAAEDLAADADTSDPVTTGDEWLADGRVACRCDQGTDVPPFETTTVILGVMVLNGAAQ